MNDRVKFRPFTGDAASQIRLDDSPLALVLCQIRWPEMNHLQGDLKPLAISFGETLKEMPIVGEVQEYAYEVTPEGVKQIESEKVFRWESLDRKWFVNLGRRFVSVYTTNYKDFEEFSERIELVVASVMNILKIEVTDRIGVRYVNRISDEGSLKKLTTLVKPEVLGNVEVPTKHGDVSLIASSNQSMYRVEDLSLNVRSGMVPAGESVDPAISALDCVSWILDLDSSSEKNRALIISDVLETVGKLSDTAYDYFKFAVQKEFVEEFGG